MSDLLKEAIADAKAVRETALQNAKMALEEAFTPQLKSMLSAKLREDDDDIGDEEEVATEAAPHGGAQALETPPTTNSDEDPAVREQDEDETEEFSHDLNQTDAPTTFSLIVFLVLGFAIFYLLFVRNKN